jgi:hypothetical protein
MMSSGWNSLSRIQQPSPLMNWIAGKSISWMQSRGALAILVLTMVGYPLVGILVSYLDVDSRTLTVPYRALVSGMAVAILGSGFLCPLFGKMDPWLLAFIGIYLLRLLYDAGSDIPGASDALLFFLVAGVLPILAVTAVGIDAYSDKAVAAGVVLVGFCVVSLAVLGNFLGIANLFVLVETEGRLGFTTVNPISLGHAAASTVFCAFYLLTLTGQKVIWRAVCVCAITLGVQVLLQTISRGPLIALGIVMLWFVLSRPSRAAYLLPVGLLLTFFVSTQDSAFQRVENLFEGGAGQLDVSALERLDVQSRAIDDFLESPIVGKYFLDPSLGEGHYPHNIFIETGMALGLPGLIILGIVVFHAGRAVLMGFSSEHPVWFMLIIQFAVCSQLSGAIWGDASLLMPVSVAIGSMRSRPPQATDE